MQVTYYGFKPADQYALLKMLKETANEVVPLENITVGFSKSKSKDLNASKEKEIDIECEEKDIGLLSKITEFATNLIAETGCKHNGLTQGSLSCGNGYEVMACNGEVLKEWIENGPENVESFWEVTQKPVSNADNVRHVTLWKQSKLEVA